MRPREIARGIASFAARTPTLPPAADTNSYALGTRDVLLVEPATPYDDEQRAWLAWARALPSTGRRPIAIVPTHHHPDHVGGLDVFARELGLPVWAHTETTARLGKDAALVTRALADGDTIVLDGPVPDAWDVLHTPGHAPGHICLHHAQTGTILVGDMVASVGTILIAPGDGDMRVYLEQLGRLGTLGARLALPAHGDPIDDPTALFARYVAHRLAREAKVKRALAAHGAAGATVIDLVATAYDDTPAHVWPVAAISLAAHLEKIEAEGGATRRGERWVGVEPGGAAHGGAKRGAT